MGLHHFVILKPREDILNQHILQGNMLPLKTVNLERWTIEISSLL